MDEIFKLEVFLDFFYDFVVCPAYLDTFKALFGQAYKVLYSSALWALSALCFCLVKLYSLTRPNFLYCFLGFFLLIVKFPKYQTNLSKVWFKNKLE